MQLCGEYAGILDELKAILGQEMQRECAELAILTGDTRERKLAIARETLDFSYKLAIYPEYAAVRELVEHIRWLRQVLRIYGGLRPVIDAFYRAYNQQLKVIEAGLRLIQ